MVPSRLAKEIGKRIVAAVGITSPPTGPPTDSKPHITEDLIDVEIAEDVLARELLAELIRPEVIVLLSFSRIAKHCIGLAYVLEFFFSHRIVWIPVRMIFQGQFAVGLFYLLRIGFFLDSQDLVIIICH